MSSIETLLTSTDGRTIPLWMQAAPPRNYPKLEKDAQTEVCVVGGGIAGLTTAYLLLREGKRVIVVDDSPIGDGQTGRTSAHLATALDDRFMDLESAIGLEATKLHFQSHVAAVDLVEEISRRENIESEFARLDGYLFCGPRDDEAYLDRELEAAKRIGVPVERVPNLPVQNVNPPIALKFSRQGRFHPLKYLHGLCDAIERMGGRICCGNFVNDVQGGDLSKGEKCVVRSDNNTIVSADAIVVATNTPTPINDWMGIYTKQASYRTYVIALKIPRGSVPDALYWDTGDPKPRHRPYHYIRVEHGDDDDLLLVGGEDHKVGQFDAEHPFEALQGWAVEHFPQVGEIVSKWSGQVQEPSDGVAFIGRAPTAKPNVYVITGDSGMGLTHGTLGGRLVSDLILGRKNAWERVYDPTRKPTGAKKDFLAENLNAVKTYTDYVKPPEVRSEDQIDPDSGALMQHGLKKVAVYKDPDGKTHCMSAVCTHLGCVVHWNPIEKSWDCPCHGSRFSPHGEVIMGPAVRGLPKVEQ